MRSTGRRPSVVAMTSELVIADLDQGGAPMIGAPLAIGVVGGLVYLVRSRRRSDRDEMGDQGGEE
jgi:hypothetical protein